MIKLRPIGSNMNEVECNGKSILFSYETPVAGYDEQGAFRTEEQFSATTTRHINKYLDRAKDLARVVPQTYIEDLLK